MASVRRIPVIARRTGASAQIGDEDVGAFPTLKLPNPKTLMVGGGLMASLSKSVSSWMRSIVSVLLFQQHFRIRDRLGGDGVQWSRAYYHVFVFFAAGAFIGLAMTPFLWVENRGMVSEANDMRIDVGKLELLNNSVVVEVEPHSQRLLIVVTPTYVRPFQAYYLNRLAHTLRNVAPPLLWIVVEMTAQSAETVRILRGTRVVYRHLVCEKNVTKVKERGLYQRNVALSHIESYRLDGIVHFADDNGVYSLDLFEEMRRIRRFGAWPVAIVAGSEKKLMVEGPVCNGRHVVGWHAKHDEKSRRFRAEMGGFAFNSTVLWQPSRWYQDAAEPIDDGLEEIAYVEQLLENESETECIVNNQSFIKVWHLDLESPKLVYPKGWIMTKNLDVVSPLT